MRNISVNGLAKLKTKLATEPLNFITVRWTPTTGIKYYADKWVDGTPLESRILKLSSIENIVKISDNAKAQSVSITLSDIDGELKHIFDTVDIHKITVKVWQWFLGLSFTDAFVVFEGQINSPIIWSEGERTLTFDIVEGIENQEVGFSPEEGALSYVSEEMIGKAFPLGFGTLIRVPALQVNKPPSGILADPLVIGSDHKNIGDKILQNGFKINALKSSAYLNEIYALEAAFTADFGSSLVDSLNDPNLTVGKARQFIEDFNIGVDNQNANQPTSNPNSGAGVVTLDGQNVSSPTQTTEPFTIDYTPVDLTITAGVDASTLLTSFDDTTPLSDVQRANLVTQLSNSNYSKFKGLQKQYEDKAAQDLIQAAKIQEDNQKLITEYNAQKNLVKDFSAANVIWKDNIIPNGTVDLKIGGTEVVASVINGIITGVETIDTKSAGELLQAAIDGQNITADTNLTPKPQSVKALQPGAQIVVLNWPITYVVNLLPVTIIEVLTKISGNPVYIGVPQNYYEVIYQNIGPYIITILYFPTPLSSLGFEDDILVSYISPVGPNTIDIIEWMINTYLTPTYSFDPVSFNHVKMRVDSFPSNFVLFERKDINKLLQEICFQARIAIWIEDNIFKVRYLPEDLVAVDTITSDDIAVGSLQIECTRTEDVKTKLVGTYKIHYEDKTPNKIVVRWNAQKYGILEENIDYYIYNIPACVYQSITFWLIRKANVYKILKFKTYLNKLNLETFDVVNIALDKTYVSNNPVKGIVQSANYDSDNNTVDMEVWVPVRLGEMKAYDFAFPADLSVFSYFPNNTEITDLRTGKTSSPNNSVKGEIPRVQIKTENSPTGTPSKLNDQNNNRTRDMGNSNVSDNKANQVLEIQYFQAGATDTTSGGAGVVTLTQNSGDTIPKIGDKISVGPNTGRTVTAVASVPSADGLTRNVALGVNPPLSVPVAKGAPILSGQTTVGTLSSQLNTNRPDYKFRNYTTPSAANPADLKKLLLPDDSGGTGSIPGQIVDGTGDTYTVNIYAAGLDKMPKLVTVKQLEIDPDETIPADTWVLVSKTTDGKYHMQVPVWM